MLKGLISKVRKNKKGFTLIELIVVIAILGILALILIPSVTGIIGTANDNTDKANAKTAYMAAQILTTQIAAGNSTFTDDAAFITSVEASANIPTDSATLGIVTSNGTSITKFTYKSARPGAKTVTEPSGALS
jgi:type IV pilus assembly protein PilA